MDYNLAKQLKDSGFNQHSEPQEDRTATPQLYIERPRYMYDPRPHVHYPTLSELIEACGGVNFAIVKDKDGWMASNDIYKDIVMCTDADLVTGDTPEEAVAKLWLALNKKG